MDKFSEVSLESITEMAMKIMIKMMWVNTIQNCFAIGCCTVLAIVFNKWWLIFVAALFWKNINPVKMLASIEENKK